MRLFLRNVLGRRSISNSTSLMQQYVARQAASGSMRSFGQPQVEANEDAIDEVGDAYGQAASRSTMNRPTFMARTPSTSTSSVAMESKVGINPFPEEVTQDYASQTLFSGASEAPFSKDITEILQAELNQEDVEIKPDGALYLPESRYRKVLCRAFGAGGWCLIPRGAHSLSSGVLSREYALYCDSRFISQARGHASIQGFSNPALASEVVRSNALMRVCKDIGVGNELWDPAYCSNWRTNYAIRRIDNGKVRWSKKDGQSQ